MRPDLPPGDTQRDSQYKKRAKELRDRSGYLKNVWYAAALSDKVKDEPVKVLLCGKEMVIWRDQETGAIRCIDNACPHRGAPLSEGWVETKESHSCVVCPYHGWALDGKGAVHDVPVSCQAPTVARCIMPLWQSIGGGPPPQASHCWLPLWTVCRLLRTRASGPSAPW